MIAVERSTADVVVMAATSLPVIAAYGVVAVAACQWFASKFSPGSASGVEGAGPPTGATSHPCVPPAQGGLVPSPTAQPQRGRGGASTDPEVPRGNRADDGTPLVAVSGPAPGGQVTTTGETTALWEQGLFRPARPNPDTKTTRRLASQAVATGRPD